MPFANRTMALGHCCIKPIEVYALYAPDDEFNRRERLFYEKK